MLHPVFDIASEDLAPDQWMRCRLVLEINRDFLQYAVLQETKLLCWKYYQLAPASPAEKNALVESVFQTDGPLQAPTKEQIIVYNFPKNCLLPESLFDLNANRPLLELMQGDLRKGPVVTEKVSGWQLYNIFRLPAGLDELCQNRFPHAAFRHHVSLWLACLDKEQEGVHLLFSAYELAVCILQQQKLQLVQSYPYTDHDELLYHLLNIFAQLGLSQKETRVYAAGMVQPDSVLYRELTKYFAGLQTATLSEKFKVPDAFQAVPVHFFSSLIKMSACV